jgi:hypothetical protein
VVKGLIRASRPSLIEGYAIVSADCMIADADGTMDALKFEVDQQFFVASLDAAAAVVHGRHSAEGRLGAARRHRLILTCRIAALARDPRNSRALLWNPAGASFEDAWCALDAPDGVLAVIGGTDVFGHYRNNRRFRISPRDANGTGRALARRFSIDRQELYQGR